MIKEVGLLEKKRNWIKYGVYVHTNVQGNCNDLEYMYIINIV